MNQQQQERLWWAWTFSQGRKSYLWSCFVDGLGQGALLYVLLNGIRLLPPPFAVSEAYSGTLGAMFCLLLGAGTAYFRGTSKWQHCSRRYPSSTAPNHALQPTAGTGGLPAEVKR